MQIGHQGKATVGTRATILLAEDDADLRRALAGTLRHAGYAVLEAGDGLEAFLLGEAHPGAIDLLISDVDMPRMDGPELADHLALLHGRAKVLFMSGHPRDQEAGEDPEAWAGACDAFLPKPFTPSLLLDVVGGLLAPALEPDSGPRRAAA